MKTIKSVILGIGLLALITYGILIGLSLNRQRDEQIQKRIVLKKECIEKGGSWFSKDEDFLNYCRMPNKHQCAKKEFGVTLKNGDYFGKCKDEKNKFG